MQVSQQVRPLPQGLHSAHMAQPQGGANSSWRTWHSDADMAERKRVLQEILFFFQRRRPAAFQQWGNKLPDFVKRLEDALYRSARSKEEYADLNTLEQRLQDVARRMVQRPGGQPGAPQGNAVPDGPISVPNTNGMPTNGLGNTYQNGQTPSFGQAQQPPFMNGSHNSMGAANGMAPSQYNYRPDGGMNTTQTNYNAPHTGLSSMPIPNNSFSADGNNLQQPVQFQPMNQLQQPPSSYPSTAANPIMQNGAPVLLRNGNRDSSWTVPNMQQPVANPSKQIPGGVGPGVVPVNAMAMMPTPMSGMVPVTSSFPSSNGYPQPMQIQNTAPTATIASPAMGPSNGNPPVGPGVMPGSTMMPTPMSGMVPVTSSFPSSNGYPQPMQMQGTTPTAALASPTMSSNNGNPPGGGNEAGPGDQATQQVQKQQRWLLFLRHCAKCQETEQSCQYGKNCRVGKELWQHILQCHTPNCTWPRCSSSRELLKHHQRCQTPTCPICAPVRDYVRKSRMQNGNPRDGTSGPMSPPTSAPSFPGAMKRSRDESSNGQLINMNSSGLLPGMPSGPLSSGLIQTGMPILPDDGPVAPNPKKPRTITSENMGTSLVEFLSPEQIHTHIEMCRKTAETAPKSALPAAPEDACKVCGLGLLSFEPPCLYCYTCGCRIKRGSTYYATPPDMETKGAWCHACFTNTASDKLVLELNTVKKDGMVKKKNDEDSAEGWVACDACNGWVHQICGLFNKGRNEQEAQYLCPECLAKGLETKERVRPEERPQSMLEAKELPQSKLSQFLEARLHAALGQDLVERAKQMNRSPSDPAVPRAEPLTIRVINCVRKKCEVRPKFLEAFQETDDYPSEFGYKQKVLLLFQNLDGVDVCLYCMYVQEYGPDCPAPNRNCVYLSYLDSIKYFRPEGTTVANSNTSLRTFVYHQVLLGYLDYIKKLGFDQMYIWACPPLQGDDYILYCHPSRQKTPRSDRLRAWYHDMLRKAKEEGIVLHLTTLWDTYFEGGRDHRQTATAAAIPYLEGDYWPGEAENLLANMSDASRPFKKGKKQQGGNMAADRKGAANKGKRYALGPGTTDEQLMSKLGEILGGNMKEDFIVVHLQEPCTFCRKHITGEEQPNIIHRYRPPAVAIKPPPERKFEGIKLEVGSTAPAGPVTHLQLCQGCYTEEAGRLAAGQRTRMPPGVSLQDLSAEQVHFHGKWEDTDPNMESEFFETRQAFLSLCQGNHYQFDTLRRAKHSSMMVLYHLHNPGAPAYSSTCNNCSLEIEPGQGLRCTTCQDFDMCNSCFNKNVPHPHPLVPNNRQSGLTAEAREKARREREQQMHRTMQLLEHACSCNNPNCQSNSCRKVRQLFQHAVQCQQKVTGGCPHCRRMWCLLNFHAKSCTRSDCPVPRCKELKELRRRTMARQEEKRRAAYQAMLRNQAANGSGAGMD